MAFLSNYIQIIALKSYLSHLKRVEMKTKYVTSGQAPKGKRKVSQRVGALLLEHTNLAPSL